MNTAELRACLEAAGCTEHSYAIGSRGTASDAYCLVHNGLEWTVFYTERGMDSEPIFHTASESDATAFFYKKIMSLPHEHCVGFFRSQSRANATAATLAAAGVPHWWDQIPYSGPRDLRYRVFVTGPAIFQARDVLGSKRLSDC